MRISALMAAALGFALLGPAGPQGLVLAQTPGDPAARPKSPPAAQPPAKAGAPRSAAAATPPPPATPLDGEWTVQDGSARMRLGACGGEASICGHTAWTRDPPGIDHRNPDPAKRQNSIIGTQILIDMRPAKPNRWEGRIYNPRDGKFYDASVTLRGGGELRVEGCLIGFLCGGEIWTRYDAPEPAPAAAAKAAPRAPAAASGARKERARTPPARESEAEEEE